MATRRRTGPLGVLIAHWSVPFLPLTALDASIALQISGVPSAEPGEEQLGRHRSSGIDWRRTVKRKTSSKVTFSSEEGAKRLSRNVSQI